MRTLCILWFAVAGCVYVPEGEIRGTREVGLGEATQLRLYCDDLFSGWERVPCGRDWQVQGTPGGNATVGTITSCGEYTAPASLPLDPVEISASECDFASGCADACGSSATITLLAPP